MPYAMVTVFTNVAVAEEPAHRAIRKPKLTTSARPRRSTSSIVGVMIWSTTLGANARRDASSSDSSTWLMVVAPRNPDR
jgi:hypothetical protein